MQTTLTRIRTRPWEQDEIGLILARYHHRLNACYQSAFEAQLDHGGRFRVSLVTQARGRVRRVHVRGASAADRELLTCLRNNLKLLDLPPSDTGGRLTFDFWMTPPFKLPRTVRARVQITTDFPVEAPIRRRLRNCLATALAHAPQVDQQMRLSFRLGSYGVPQDVYAFGEQTENPLATCAIRRTQELRLEDITADGRMTLGLHFKGRR